MSAYEPILDKAEKLKNKFPKTSKFSKFMLWQVGFFMTFEAIGWVFSYKHACQTYAFCADNLNVLAEDIVNDFLLA